MEYLIFRLRFFPCPKGALMLLRVCAMPLFGVEDPILQEVRKCLGSLCARRNPQAAWVSVDLKHQIQFSV